MNRKLICYGYILVSLSSCASIVHKLQGANNKRTFLTTASYLEYAQKKNDLPADSFIYADSKSGQALANYYNAHPHLYEYLGAFYNDSTEVKKSRFFKADDLCPGRTVADLDTAVNSPFWQQKRNDFFHQIHFLYLKKVRPFVFKNNGKLKIFLLYSSKYGTVFKQNYEYVFEFAQRHPEKVEVYIISLDYFDDGKG